MSHQSAALRRYLFLCTSLLMSASLNAGTLFKPPWKDTVGGVLTSVAVGDLNRDGNPDLVVANGFGGIDGQGSVAILLGYGNGTFYVSKFLSSGAGFPMSVAVADLNRDGKLDLVVANCGSPSMTNFCPNGEGIIATFLGNGNGTFQAPTTYGSGGGQARSVVVADVNLDGKPDVVVGNGCGDQTCTTVGGVGVMLGNGDGTLQSVVTYAGVGQGSVAVADVNRDGKPDLVTVAGGVNVLLGNGDGTFQLFASYNVGGLGASSVAIADVNGDHKPDVVVVNNCGNAACTGLVSILLGNGDGTFQPTKTYGTGGRYSSAAVVLDVNGDHKPDVVVTSDASNGSTASCNPTDTSVVAVLLGNGDGTFTRTPCYRLGGSVATSVAAADVNRDSRPDLIVTNYFSADVDVLLNDGPYSTSTILRSHLNPSIYGQSVTLRATVASHAPVAPTGKVGFRWSLNGLRYTIGTALLNANGVATLSKANLNAYVYPITAVYFGDAVNQRSTSAVLKQVVKQTTSAAQISSSLNPSSLGQLVTFTASITSPTVTPTGPVTFMAGKTVLGTAQLSAHKARLPTSVLPVGSTVITAIYYGDSNIAKSSASITQVVH
jgi:Bacterial Ig-like domain (group 3)/FG-GAP-like repeat/FG-GAP repeat